MRWVKACDGELVLRDSRFDPVADLPVRSLVEVTVGERNAIQRGRIHSTVPAEWIIPYHPPALRRPLPDRRGLSGGDGVRGQGRGRDRRGRWHRPGTRPRPARPGAPAWSSPTSKSPALEAAVDELRVARRRCAGCAPTWPTRDSVVALADDVYGTEGRCDLLFANAGVTSGGGGLPWEQEINDWRWCFSVNVFGVADDRAHLPAPDARGGDAGRGRRHLVGRRRRGPGALRQRLRLVQGGGQLLHRGRRPPVRARSGRRSRAHVFYPAGGLLDTGLWTAHATGPPSSSGSGPARPPRGPRSPSSRPSSRRPGCPTEVVDLDWLGRQVLDDLDEGPLRPRPRRRSVRPAAPRPGRRHRHGRAAPDAAALNGEPTGPRRRRRGAPSIESTPTAATP